MRSFIASIHKLTPKRSGRNDPSAESSEEASATSSPQSSAEDAFPRFCLSLPTSPRPGDQPCRRSRVGNEGTLPAAPKEAKQTAPFRLPVLPHGASESFPQREPGPSTTTWAGRETDAAWAQFLGGQKPADEDASSYYPPWSNLSPTAQAYFEGREQLRGSERVRTKSGTSMVVMALNPFPTRAVQWKDVDWNGPGRGGQNLRAEDDDQDEGEDGQAGVDPRAAPPRPHRCSLELRRRAGVASRSAENRFTKRIARSLLHPSASPRLRAAWHRVSPWEHRSRPSEALAEPAHRAPTPSAPVPQSRDTGFPLHGAQRRGAASQGHQVAGPKSKCWWTL